MTRILFETGSTCVGGAERVILRIAQGLRKLRPDWQVDAVILCNRGGLEEEYQATFHHVWDGPGPNCYYQSGLRIAALISQEGYRIVHCIDSFPLTEAAAILRPCTAFVQNVFPNCRTSPFAPPAGWRADGYAAIVTEFVANLPIIEQRYGRPQRKPGIFRAIPNGIDVNFWTPGTGQRDVDVVWCARTDPEKGIQKAMELVPLLCAKGLRYQIVTSERDGPVENLDALAKAWPRFAWRAKLSPEQLRHLFQRTKIFLSTSSAEGMPATPLEAAACGCWPIVPDIDGLTECFASGLLKYQPWATVELLAAIVVYDLRANIEGKIVPRVREIAERYSLQRMVDSYLALYTEILR